MCAQIGGPGRVLNSRLVTSAEQRQLQTGIPGGLQAPRPGVSARLRPRRTAATIQIESSLLSALALGALSARITGR